MTWKATPEGVVIPIKVSPKASRNSIVGWENGELKIRIAALPSKGSANQELLVFLAKELKIGKGQIKLISGDASRHKRICICGLNPQNIWFLQDKI